MEALEPLVERASEPAGARTAMPIHVRRKAAVTMSVGKY